MNLNENIHRIQEMMGVISENRIINIINELGLHDAIRYFGGYGNIIDLIGDYKFSNEEKIDFIRDAIKHLTEKYNTTGISAYELGMSPIRFGTPDPMGLELQYIEYFNVEFIVIDDYDSDSHISNFREKYENLDDETLDNIFIFMIDAIEHHNK